MLPHSGRLTSVLLMLCLVMTAPRLLPSHEEATGYSRLSRFASGAQDSLRASCKNVKNDAATLAPHPV